MNDRKEIIENGERSARSASGAPENGKRRFNIIDILIIIAVIALIAAVAVRYDFAGNVTTRTETAKAEQPKAAAAKPAPAKATTSDKPKLSLLKAAIAVLEGTDEALNTKQMIEQAKAKGLWTPGEGKTPEQTLYSAIAREIKAKGENSRFKLVTKGHFKLASR